MNRAVSIFDQLSVFELIELTYLQREAMFMNMTIFLTVLTGFLALTYLIANKLDRLEALSISTLYSAVSIFLIFDYTQIAFRTFRTAAYLSGNTPNPVVYVMIPLLMSLGWLLSIWYIIRKRRLAT